MKKKKLLQMRRLMATSKMIKIAKNDVPQNARSNAKCYQAQRKYQLYLRCQVENGILKAALYYPDSLRSEGRLPSYVVYIDREARRFVTYDCINNKWLEAKVDRLDWPHYVPCQPSTWISDRDSKAAGQYLGSEKTGYDAIHEYQLKLRLEARKERYRKETSKWDADMALTPALPKDWDRWVDKVGIPQNFIFYEYRRGGAKTGYCTFCGKDVPLREKPLHNKVSRCPCCRHEITYKSLAGWAGFRKPMRSRLT